MRLIRLTRNTNQEKFVETILASNWIPYIIYETWATNSLEMAFGFNLSV